MADGPDPYKVLQVDPEAEDEVIQAAYRRLAQKYHPDRAAGTEAVERMVALNAAWELIGEPDRRAAYDLEVRGRRMSRHALGGEDAGGAGATAGSGGSPAHPGSPGGSTHGAATSHGQPAGPTGRAAGSSTPPRPQRPPETVSTEWTTGRSTVGSGYDAATMRAPEGFGAAGPPPGNASGSVLNFGRYAGWSLGEISRADIEYIEWLDRATIGRMYREEVDVILRRAGRRKSASTQADERRGLFRRR
jgi:curved DNA-binding protein CbpA